MNKKIAVIGAGLAGITFACKMKDKFNVKIFEKSRGVGGRMSTRKESPFIFDHGAQFFKIKTTECKKFFSKLFTQEIRITTCNYYFQIRIFFFVLRYHSLNFSYST